MTVARERWLYILTAAAVFGLMTQYRCGLTGEFHEWGTPPDHEVVARSYVRTWGGERIAGLLVSVSDDNSSGWLHFACQLWDTKAYVGVFHPETDHLDVQLYRGDDWQSWNVGFFPPRISEWDW